MPKSLDWGIYLIALLLPWEYIGSFKVFNITLRPAQVVALITLALWLTTLISKKIKLQPNFLAKPALIFLTIAALSILNATNRLRAVEVLLFTTFIFLVSWLVSQIITNEQKLKTTIKFLLLGSVLTGIFGLYQYLGDLAGLPANLTGLRPNYSGVVLELPRIHGPALEPIYLANYLLIPLALLLVYLIYQPSQKTTNQKVVLTLLLVIFFLTLSRSGYLALLIILITLGAWLIIRPHNPITKKLLTKLGIIFLAALALTYILWLIPQAGQLSKPLTLLFKHSTQFGNTFSYLERATNYQLAGQAWRQHPYLGIGAGNFGHYAISHYYRWLKPEQAPIVNNETLEILAETGLLGILAMFYLVIVLYQKIGLVLKKFDYSFLSITTLGLTLALVGILIQYQFFSILYLLPIWFTIGLLVAAVNLRPNSLK